MKILTALFFAVTISAAAQTSVEVPHKMEFAGMTLIIRDDARREIQNDVDALTRSPKHFMIKAEKARTYFPIIEKIFATENVPDDFKYLVLQESALVADAVSVSNAVGFWQFKDFTAMEMGLRVDKEIDERMNIASSTRAAAKYIKKNNTLFDNWLYALQAYQMGAGGVMRSEKDTHNGAKHAEITTGTYWYVKKFLAHKIAYEQAVEGAPSLQVTVHENKSKKSLADLSQEVSISESELQSYNKWIKSGSIPDDRTYIVLIPGASGSTFETLPSVLAAASAKPTTTTPVTSAPKADVAQKEKGRLIKINGINAMQAFAGDNAVKIATRANVDLVEFLKWNDITYSTQIIAGAYYFLDKKRSKGSAEYHTMAKGDDVWSVSQKYGVKLKKLKRYNRLGTDAVPIGTTLWLSAMKPKSAQNQVVTGAVAELSQGETFNWDATPQKDSIVTSMVEEAKPMITIVSPELSIMKNQLDSTKNLQLAQETKVSIDSTVQIVVPESPIQNGDHVVQPKETLYAIAKQYNVSVMDLVNWNGLDLQQGLKIGQVLKVSTPELIAKVEIAPVEVIHEVVASDTLYGIARKYDVTIKDLMDWNAKKDFSVAVGEKLLIKKGQ